MKRIIYTLIILAIVANPSYSQLSEQWCKTILPGENQEQYENTNLKVEPNGNTYVAGRHSIGTGIDRIFSYFIISYDASGVQRYHGYYYNLSLISSYMDNNYNMYTDVVTSNYPKQYYVQKFTPTGACIWSIESPYEGKLIIGDNNGYAYRLCSDYTGVDYLIKYSNSGAVLNTYTIPNNISVYNFAVDDTNYVIASTLDSSFSHGLYVYKITPSGTMLWNSYYRPDGMSLSSNYKLSILPNGQIYVLSRCYYSSSGYDYLLSKYDSAGEMKWVSTFNSNGFTNDYPYTMEIDNSENICIIGSTSTVKYDSSGTFLWRHDLARSSLTFDKNNNLYLASTLGSCIRISRLSNDGQILWDYDYYTPNETASSCSVIDVDTLNNVYIAGSMSLTETALGAIAVKLHEVPVTYTISGTVKFQDNQQLVSSGYVKAFHFDRSTGIITTVDSTGIQANGTYVLPHVPQDTVDIMAFQDDEEEQSFVPTYHPSTIYWENSVKLYPTGNLSNIDIGVYRIINTTGAYHIGGHVYTDSEQDRGSLKDAIMYARVGNNFKGYSISLPGGAYCIDSLSASNYEIICNRMGYYSAIRPVQLTTFSMDTIDYYLTNVMVKIEQQGNIVPDKFSLYQNYPNPFNPVTKIRFDIPKEVRSQKLEVRLTVYDLLGKEAAILVNERMNEGTYEVTWNASNFPSGVYFYKLQVGDYAESKKMVLIK